MKLVLVLATLAMFSAAESAQLANVSGTWTLR